MRHSAYFGGVEHSIRKEVGTISLFNDAFHKHRHIGQNIEKELCTHTVQSLINLGKVDGLLREVTRSKTERDDIAIVIAL